MRWKRGSRAFLRLPCAWLLLLLPLAAAAGLGEDVATSGHRHHVTFPDYSSASFEGGDTRPSAVAESSEEGVRGAERGSEEDPSMTARSGRRLDEDEESRILWRGWLLVDEAPTRRKAHITPKSVFIAPVIRGEENRGGGIPACAEGYRSDVMGRCHKVVRVNPAAHLDFLLQRLNARFREPSPPAASATSQGDAEEKGPLLVTIPLATNPPQNEESEGEEEGDVVDLVVVVEAGMQKDAPGGMPDRFGLFGGEQVTAESQDDVVVRGGAGTPTETHQKNAEDKLMNAAVVAVEKNATGAVVRDQMSGFVEGNNKQMAMAQLQAHTDLSIEPVSHFETSNSTEESNMRREISGTDSAGQPPIENLNDRINGTTAFITTESSINETNAERTTDVHFANSHIYETTFITNYPTTESGTEKVTELPELLHKQNQEIISDGNFSDDKTEEAKEEFQKRIVFPGRVDERVRFPDTEEHKSPYALYPSTTASSETHSSTPPHPQKSTSRPWGVWNRPMLLKFWTQMPLVREPTQVPDSVAKGLLPATSDGDTSSYVKRGESWSLPIHSDTQSKVHQGGPYQRRPWIYYQEMSPRDLASVSRVFDRVKHFESQG